MSVRMGPGVAVPWLAGSTATVTSSPVRCTSKPAPKFRLSTVLAVPSSVPSSFTLMPEMPPPVPPPPPPGVYWWVWSAAPRAATSRTLAAASKIKVRVLESCRSARNCSV